MEVISAESLKTSGVVGGNRRKMGRETGRESPRNALRRALRVVKQHEQYNTRR